MSNFGITTATSGTPVSNPAFSFGSSSFGDKYVTETANPGWTLTGVSCTGTVTGWAVGTGQGAGFNQGASSGFVAGENTLKVTVGAGDSPTCTFTNTRDQGSIELQKVWSGNGGQTTLQIGTTPGGAEVTSKQTGTGGTAPLSTGTRTVDTGTYYVSESGGLANYTASAPSCFNDNGAGGGTAGNGVKDGSEQTVSVGANGGVSVGKNDKVVCSITNTRQSGSIELKKVWSGTAGQTTLQIGTTSGAHDVANVQTGAAGATPLTTGAMPVDTGTYFVSESGGLGGYTSSLDCVNAANNNAPVTVTSGAVQVGSGDQVVCTFTNTRDRGSIELQKVWSGNGGQTTLQIGTTAGAHDTANVTTGAAGAAPLTTTAKMVDTGTYYVSESGGLTNYTASAPSCFNDNGAGNGTAGNGVKDGGEQTVSVDANGGVSVGKGDKVLCSITNTRKTGTIQVKKVWSGTPGQTTLQIGTTSGGSEVTSKQTGADGAAPLATDVKTVDTGTYYVSESGGLGNYTPSLDCVNTANNNASVTVGSGGAIQVGNGDTIVCTFTNTRMTGTIELDKTWNGPAGSTTLNIGTSAGGSEIASKPVAGNGGIAAKTVDTGTYYVSETPSGNANATDSSLSCVNAANNNAAVAVTNGSVQVGSGDQVVCTFTNMKRFKVIVIVCDRTNDQLYASNVTFDQADATRSIGHGDVSDALEAQLCGLGGATHVGAWDANHTHRADISIGATPTPLSPQAI
jgi:hypothetical protein